MFNFKFIHYIVYYVGHEKKEVVVVVITFPLLFRVLRTTCLYFNELLMEPFQLAVTQLQCDEVIGRTSIACEEQRGFSYLVSLRIFEQHGSWKFVGGEEDNRVSKICHNCGSHCPFCVDEGAGAETSIWKRVFQLHGDKMHTPFCSVEENGAGCQYSRDAGDILDRRCDFYKQEGQHLLRIQRASRAIRHHWD